MQRLSADCEDQIRVILQESALDYRLDPQLQLHCSEEVYTHTHTHLLNLRAVVSLPTPPHPPPSDLQVVCGGGSGSGADGSGGRVSESQPAESQTRDV